MRIPVNDLQRQALSIEGELNTAVSRVIRSGRYVGGPELEAFEQAFARACSRRYCIGVGNGYDAIEIGLRGLGIGAGDEVVTVANAGGFGSLAILMTKALPVYVDIDWSTMNIDAAKVEGALTRRTRAIIVTHLYGRLAPMEPIVRIARAAGISIIEDAAQAHGAVRNGRPAGGYGDVGCFSFYPTKCLGAVGDAGAIVTDDEELATKVRALRQYGWRERMVAELGGGRNSRLDEIQAAVLHLKLRHLDVWNARRRAIDAAYRAAIEHPDIDWPDAAGEDHAVHLCVLRSRDRDRLRAHLTDAGVGTSVHYPVPDYGQPALKAALSGPVSLPVTERASREVLTLPNFPEMTTEEVGHVIEAVRKAVAFA